MAAVAAPRRQLRGCAPLAAAFAVVLSVNLLPPDTALGHIEQAGRITVCMPLDYPPLVAPDPDRPGFDAELVGMIADRAGWTLGVNGNPSMGRDFNPRSWRVTRAQCQMLAGGIVLSPTTRSFLDTTAGHLRTGWVIVAPEPGDLAPGQRVGFYPGLAGLDRVRLGQYLRGLDVSTTLLPTAESLRDALARGEIDAAITEALVADRIFDAEAFPIDWLPEELGRYPIGLGFWKGDFTLRRRVDAILADLRAEGALAAPADRYGLGEQVLCGETGC